VDAHQGSLIAKLHTIAHVAEGGVWIGAACTRNWTPCQVSVIDQVAITLKRQRHFSFNERLADRVQHRHDVCDLCIRQAL
jgi:hypothetical protein